MIPHKKKALISRGKKGKCFTAVHTKTKLDCTPLMFEYIEHITLFTTFMLNKRKLAYRRQHQKYLAENEERTIHVRQNPPKSTQLQVCNYSECLHIASSKKTHPAGNLTPQRNSSPLNIKLGFTSSGQCVATSSCWFTVSHLRSIVICTAILRYQTIDATFLRGPSFNTAKIANGV